MSAKIAQCFTVNPDPVDTGQLVSQFSHLEGGKKTPLGITGRNYSHLAAGKGCQEGQDHVGESAPKVEGLHEHNLAVWSLTCRHLKNAEEGTAASWKGQQRAGAKGTEQKSVLAFIKKGSC